MLPRTPAFRCLSWLPCQLSRDAINSIDVDDRNPYVSNRLQNWVASCFYLLPSLIPANLPASGFGCLDEGGAGAFEACVRACRIRTSGTGNVLDSIPISLCLGKVLIGHYLGVIRQVRPVAVYPPFELCSRTALYIASTLSAGTFAKMLCTCWNTNPPPGARTRH